jgi:hypothetical protein
VVNFYRSSLALQALKTKHDTPKYGLIYHAQLVGQASTKLKGKVSHSLAAPCLTPSPPGLPDARR